MTIDGEFLAGCSVIDEMPYLNRGWFVAYAGEALRSGFQVRPLIDKFADLKRLGPYDELRAWVVDGDAVDERFAKRMGFELDCGPASGYGPSGQDMNLWLWRRSHDE